MLKPSWRIFFIRAKNPTTAFFSNIPFSISVSEYWVLRIIFSIFQQCLIALCDNKLMLNRDCRYFNSKRSSCSLGMVSSSSNDVLRSYFEGLRSCNKVPARFNHFIAFYNPFITIPRITISLALSVNFNPTVSSSFCHSLSNVSRVYITVSWVIYCTL